MVEQHVGELRDLGVQLAVADVLGDVRVVALPDDRGLVAAGGEVAVDAVGRDVELAVLEPFDRDVVVVERGVLDAGVGLDPVEPPALLAPEGVRVGDRGGVHPLRSPRRPRRRGRPSRRAAGASDRALASPLLSSSPRSGGRPVSARKPAQPLPPKQDRWRDTSPHPGELQSQTMVGDGMQSRRRRSRPGAGGGCLAWRFPFTKLRLRRPAGRSVLDPAGRLVKRSLGLSGSPAAAGRRGGRPRSRP